MGAATSSSDSESDADLPEPTRSIVDVMEQCMAKVASNIPTGKQRVVRHVAQRHPTQWYVVWIDMTTQTPRYCHMVTANDATFKALRDEGALGSAVLAEIPVGDTQVLQPVANYTDVVSATLEAPGGLVRAEGDTAAFASDAL